MYFFSVQNHFNTVTLSVQKSIPIEDIFLKKEFGQDCTFWGGGVETVGTLNTGSPQQVRDQVLERLEIMSKGGGFVFNTVHNILDCKLLLKHDRSRYQILYFLCRASHPAGVFEHAHGMMAMTMVIIQSFSSAQAWACDHAWAFCEVSGLNNKAFDFKNIVRDDTSPWPYIGNRGSHI